jgi:hypothetical protein
MKTRLHCLLILILFGIQFIPQDLSLSLYYPTRAMVYAQESRFDICIDDFEDRNQNGIHDVGEGPFADIEVYVRTQGNQELVGSLVTSAGEDCIRSLPSAIYTLEYGGDVPFQFTVYTTTLDLTTQSVILPLGVSACRYQSDEGLNQICVLVYHDRNSNGVRDGGEAPLSNINVNLQDLSTVTENQPAVIIRTLVTQDDFACFTALPEGTYRVYIPASANHVLTSSGDSSPSFTGQSVPLCYEFGAQPLDPLNTEATLPNYSGTQDEDIELNDDTRLLLAILGAVMVILFMLGVGTILFAIIRR